MTMRSTRIVVVGVGSVGATTAYTLFLRVRAAEIVLIDIDRRKAEGEALDIQHGGVLSGGPKIMVGTYEDCATADIVIVTAGVAQKPGESRLSLLERNVKLMKGIVQQIKDSRFNGVLIVASNPVDILAYVAWYISGFPSERVLGSGTVLDSLRFRYYLGRELGVDPGSVHAQVLGEHGDTQVPMWSSFNVAGGPMQISKNMKRCIADQTRRAAYELIERKGCTNYAIALVLDEICRAILQDKHTVLTISTKVTQYHGVSDVYLSVPCVIGARGVERVIEVSMSEMEERAFQGSARHLRNAVKDAMLIIGRENDDESSHVR